MSLIVYRSEDTLNRDNFIYDVDRDFSGCSLPNSDYVKACLKELEQGEYYTESMFRDRFGHVLYVDNLSTGCKAAILTKILTGRVINLSECGNRVIAFILSFCKDGMVYIPNGRPFVAKFGYKDGDTVDITIDCIHFSKLHDAGEYLNGK